MFKTKTTEIACCRTHSGLLSTARCSGLGAAGLGNRLKASRVGRYFDLEADLKLSGMQPISIPDPQMASESLPGRFQERPRWLMKTEGSSRQPLEVPRRSQMPESFAPAVQIKALA